MKKRYVILILIILTFSIGFLIYNPNQKEKVKKMDAIVLFQEDGKVIVQDSNSIIYTFDEDMDVSVGTSVLIKYTGNLVKNESLQKVEIIDYQKVKQNQNLDNGIFKDYAKKAEKKLKTMSLEEKINQLLLVRYPEENQYEILKQYQFGGYLFFARDLKNKTKEEVVKMMKDLQEVSNIPILTAVDEEGGSVVRVSSNPNLRNEKFLSSRELYQMGGMDRIKEDTLEKSDLLASLGLNLNLAPVVDISTNPNDYMYERTIGENKKITSEYAETVIKASKNKKVSYTLKHFPGYGNNLDTHVGGSVDNRTLKEIKENDILPFKSGIKAGAEAVLFSHNIVTSMDPDNPASLSINVHNFLRNELAFTGVIITDDLSMGATESIEQATVKAILAGNDLLIVTDYEKSFQEITNAIKSKTLSEEQIDKLAFKILAWKYFKKVLK